MYVCTVMKWIKDISALGLLTLFLMSVVVSGIPHGNHNHVGNKVELYNLQEHNHDENSPLHTAFDWINELSRRHAHDSESHNHDVLRAASYNIQNHISTIILWELFSYSELTEEETDDFSLHREIPNLYQGISPACLLLRGPPVSSC